MAEDIKNEDYDNYWFGEDVATFGDRLAAARHYAGLSQEEFSRRLGVKLSTARGWEDDLNEPRANKLQMMAGLLNVSVVWLLTGEGDGVVSAPDEHDVPAPALSGLLVEIRAIKAQMKNNIDQLARLEKKLRLAVNEAPQDG